MKVGILATEHVALLLATAWEKAGHDIVLGSRDPSAKHLAFPVHTLNETLREADIVVNAIVGSVALATLSSLDATAFAGKTVIDGAGASMLHNVRNHMCSGNDEITVLSAAECAHGASRG